jgi:para-nitrobenzyl esterase
LPQAAGELVAEKFLDTLEARTPEALHAVDVAAILEAQNQTALELSDGFKSIENFAVAVSAFYPVQGNTIVPKSPIEAIREGAASDIPVLIGTNKDETTLWGYGNVDNDKLERAAATYGAQSALGTYRHTRPHASADDLMIALTTDHMFRIPAIRLVESRLQADSASRNWMYHFCWESRAFEGRLRATHALEIPFVFDNLDRAGVDVFLGAGDKPQNVAQAMHGAWTSFVTNLDPGWAPYTLDERNTMRFAENSEVVVDPDGEERQAWEGLR